MGGNATREVRDREDSRGGELREGEIRAPRRDRAGRRRENSRPEAHPISQGRRPGGQALSRNKLPFPFLSLFLHPPAAGAFWDRG